MKDNGKQRDSFILYKSHFEPLSKLSNEQLGRLFRAIYQWQITGQAEPEPDIDMAFGFLVNQFRIDNEKYRIRCEKNRDNIISRWEREGKDTNEYNRIQTNTKHTDNDNENENDNENGKGNGNDSRNGNLTLPFTDPVFVSTWNELLAQPNWKRKTTRSLKMALNQLAKYDVRFAVTLIESAIVGNYKGVTFPDTPVHYKRWQADNPHQGPTTGPSTTDLDNIYND